MKNVIFYLLKKNICCDNLKFIEILVCNITSQYWHSGNNILIACNSKIQAIKLDELLWKYPSNSFIPHNLFGEGPSCGSQIELIWPNKDSNNNYHLIINLMLKYRSFMNNFNLIIDFIPNDIYLKQLARDRYKAYRNHGFQLKIETFKKNYSSHLNLL